MNLTPRLFSQFHHVMFENCAKLVESQPDLDEEELEEKAYEITSLYFYYQARDLLMVTRRDDSGWGEGME